MVYYRKYRPQKIGELDSSSVREKLYSVLGSASVPHAFLFTGPKGLGKTSTARIIAKVLNCQKNLAINEEGKTKNKEQEKKKVQSPQDIEPCNNCDQCVSITNGTNLDILEIDGASNRGIDEIRDLREKVKLSPASAYKKVYIIDEVHMLTTEAFNALLKTLEEPPSHVVFVLCTTEPHKVPSTIISRCFHIQFNKATSEELVSSFERIIKSEKLQAESEALSQIASLSDGSFRDGSKILEEMVLSANGKKLTKKLVEEKYQISNISSKIQEMIEYLVNKDTKKALDQVSKLVDQGVDIGYFIQNLIQTLHNHFLYKAGVENSSQFTAHSLQLDIGETKKLIELLSKAHTDLKYAVLPQLPLELAVVEWCLQAQNDAEANAEKRGSSIQLSSASSSASFSDKTKQVQKEDGKNEDLWQKLISRVKTHNHSIAGVLRGCRIISYDKDKLVIEAGFKFHKERLEDPKTRGIVEDSVSEIAGRKVKVSVTLK
ncbi:DNA polymerase III subunit gamma/tau [Candidatus Roizmanbacteria bacterium]|nr:DNA polymerase III subunit gamma/tau [Candidatus Roizmanbacteria bacterium]